MWRTIKIWLLKPWVIGAILVVGIGGFLVFRGSGGDKSETFRVEKRDVVERLNVSGQVRPAKNVDLGFEVGGRVAASYVDVGDVVQAGTVLAALSSGELNAQVREAEASVKVAEAKLAELKRGTRQEDLNYYESKVASAEVSLADARASLTNTLADAYTKADDAIIGKADQLFSNPRSRDPKLLYTTGDLDLRNRLEWSRLQIGSTLGTWGAKIYTTDTATVKENLQKTKNFLDDIAKLVNTLSPYVDLTQTTLDARRADIVTARTNINTAISNVSSSEEKLRSAESSLKVAQRELDLKRAGNTQEAILSGEAEVERAKAAADSLRSQLAKTVIVAPISGIVSKQDADVGVSVVGGTTMITVISASQFEIEADIAESDIAKISLGQTARVNLDAYGNDISFEARVVKIDPAETVIDGVSTYRVKFQFTEKDERIKSGMTATIDVESKRAGGVMAIPQRFLKNRDGKQYVFLGTKKEEAQEIEVKTGLKGFDGFVEIKSGLSEGDTILIQ